MEEEEEQSKKKKKKKKKKKVEEEEEEGGGAEEEEPTDFGPIIVFCILLQRPLVPARVHYLLFIANDL